MLGEETVRRDLLPIAKEIIGRKLWPIQETADFLGYSKSQMHMNIDKWGWFIIKPGGAKHVYAIDVLAKYEELNEVEFPDLHEQWIRRFKIHLPAKHPHR